MTCDCLVDCGDDPWLKDGRSQPCAKRMAADLAATKEDKPFVPWDVWQKKLHECEMLQGALRTVSGMAPEGLGIQLYIANTLERL